MKLSLSMTQSSSSSSSSGKPTTLVKGVESFKFVGECPVLLMFFLQVYPKSSQRMLPSLIQYILIYLDLGNSPQTNTLLNTSAAKEKFRDLVSAQVKSLTFVSYIIRAHSDFMRQHESAIVRSLHSLVLRCPDDSTSIRKDLLISLKALVSSDLKKALFVYINDIINEEFLLGLGGPVRQSHLRPLAFSVMIDCVYTSKEMLNVNQLTRVVHLFCSNLHDQTLQMSIQVASVRIVLTLVDLISQHPLVSYIINITLIHMHIFILLLYSSVVYSILIITYISNQFTYITFITLHWTDWL